MFIKTKIGYWLNTSSICMVISIAITLLFYSFGYLPKKPFFYLLAYYTIWIMGTLFIVQKERECSKHIRSVKQLRDSFEILFGIIKDIDIPRKKHEALANEIINVVQEMEYGRSTKNVAHFIIKTQMVHLIGNATLHFFGNATLSILDEERKKRLEAFDDEVTRILDTKGHTTNEEE